MSRLTRDGTGRSNLSRETNFSGANGDKETFPCSADHVNRIGNFPADLYSAICDDNTYIHIIYCCSVYPHFSPFIGALWGYCGRGFLLGNGQKRELPVLFGQKRMYPENNRGRECCWPYLIGQHPLSPVFGQKRPGTPGNSYFAQLPPVFGHFLFRF